MRIVRSSERLLQEAGQGDAVILKGFEPKPNHGLDMLYDAAKTKKELSARNALHKAQFAPPGTKDPEYQEQLNNNYQEKYASKQLDPLSTHQVQADLLTEKNSADALHEHQKAFLQNTNKLPDYYDKVGMAADARDNYYMRGKDGKLDYHAITNDGLKNVEKISNDGKYINQDKMYADYTKGLPLQMQSNDVLKNSSLGQQVISTDKGAAFVKPRFDKNGKQIGVEPGVSDQLVDYVAQNNPEARKAAVASYDQHIQDKLAEAKASGDTRPDAEIVGRLEKETNLPTFIKQNIKTNLENHNKHKYAYSESKISDTANSEAEKEKAQFGDPTTDRHNFVSGTRTKTTMGEDGLPVIDQSELLGHGVGLDFKPLAAKSGKPVIMTASSGEAFDYNTRSHGDNKNKNPIQMNVEGVVHYPVTAGTNNIVYNPGNVVNSNDSDEVAQNKIAKYMAEHKGKYELKPFIVGTHIEKYKTTGDETPSVDEETLDGGKKDVTRRVAIPANATNVEKLRVSSKRDDGEGFRSQVYKSTFRDRLNHFENNKQQEKPALKGKSANNLSTNTQRAVEAFRKAHGEPTPAQIEAIKKKYP